MRQQQQHLFVPQQRRADEEEQKKETERQAGRQTHGHKDKPRWTDRQSVRQRERQTERQTDKPVDGCEHEASNYSSLFISMKGKYNVQPLELIFV